MMGKTAGFGNGDRLSGKGRDASYCMEPVMVTMSNTLRFLWSEKTYSLSSCLRIGAPEGMKGRVAMV